MKLPILILLGIVILAQSKLYQKNYLRSIIKQNHHLREQSQTISAQDGIQGSAQSSAQISARSSARSSAQSSLRSEQSSSLRSEQSSSLHQSSQVSSQRSVSSQVSVTSQVVSEPTKSVQWRSLIIDQDFKSNKTKSKTKSKKQQNSQMDKQLEKQGLMKQEGTTLGKHIDMNKQRISAGYSSYFLDLTDEMFLQPFIKELKAAFDAFSQLPQQVQGMPNIYEGKEHIQGKCINIIQVQSGVAQFKWQTKSNPQEFFQKYDLDNDYCLEFKEFSYLVIIENINSGPQQGVQHCLNEVKTELYDFFTYLDSDKSGLISAEQIHSAFTNLKTKFKLLSIMVNDFVLNAMELKSATLDVKDFVFAELVGMFERVVKQNDTDETELNQIKPTRLENVQKGGLETNTGSGCG